MMVDLDIQLLGGRILTSAPVACTLPCVPTTEFPNFFGLIEVESVPQTQPTNWFQKVLIGQGPLNYLPVEEHIYMLVGELHITYI